MKPSNFTVIMALENKKYDPDSGSIDFISSLPDDMLLKILSYTTFNYYKEVVKCSALSKRWRSLYTISPALRLIECEMVGKSYHNLSENDRRNLMEKIVSFTLSRQKANVQDFVLEVNDMSQWNWCLKFVSNYAITDLSLVSYQLSVLEDFPFSCENLVDLNMSHVEFGLRACHLGFPKLKHCRLTFPGHSHFCYTEFLSKCSVLEYLSLSAPFSPQRAPFTFSSPSLGYLDLIIESPKNKDSKDGTRDEVEIIIEAPKLGRLSLSYFNIGCTLKVKVDAPNLYYISLFILSCDYKLVQCNQIIWNNVLLKEARWNTDRDMTYLDVRSLPRYRLFDVEDIRRYFTLQCLELTNFTIHPIKFWEMLSHHLPLLESLTLTYCSFEVDSFAVSREEDLEFDVSSTNREGSILYKKKINKEISKGALAEVSIMMDKPSGHGLEVFSGAEREMLHRFWLKAKYLKKLTVSIEKHEQLSKANYLTFFWHLISEGESVNLIMETRTTLLFQLIKENQEEILVSV